VQALDLAPLGLAAAGRAPESVLLLRITVRLYPFPFLYSISSVGSWVSYQYFDTVNAV
jgi:hypothetical protein